MPRIQEYLPEVAASGPVGGLSPELEEAGAFGRGIEKAGSDITQASDALYRRQEAEETSDIYATVADKRAELNDQLTDQTADGSLNSEQFKQAYDEWADKQADSYQTAAGRNYFKRQSARLGGVMLQKATKAQAVIAANNAVADLQSGLNSFSSTVEKDPSQFADSYHANLEHLNELVEQGVISAKDEPKFRQKIGADLSVSALRGYMQDDPDKAEKMLNAGGFDQWLTVPQKQQMTREIQQAQNAAEIESTRQDNIAKKARAAAQEKWGQQALPKLINNQLSTKEIMAAPGTWEDKHRWLEMVRQQGNLEQKTDPTVLNDIYRRVNLPSNDPQHIGDISQVVGAKGVAPADIPKITNWFDKSPQGEAAKANRKMLLDLARTKLVNGNAMAGIKDPDGEYNLMQFTSALQSAEQQQRDANKPVSDLYDVRSKDFFGNKLASFAKTPQQILAQQAAKIRGDSAPAAAPVYSTPGIVPKAPDAPANPDEELRTIKSTGKQAYFDRKTKKFLRYK